MRKYKITIPAFTQEIHAKDKEEALGIFLFNYDIAHQAERLQPQVEVISPATAWEQPKEKTGKSQKKTMTQDIADWIDTQVLVDAIDEALDIVKLPKTKVNYKQVWLLHLQHIWDMLEQHAEYLKEKKAQNAQNPSE